MQEAYQVQANQIHGGPDWLDTAAFDVEVKTGKSERERCNPEKLIAEHVALIRSMLQAPLGGPGQACGTHCDQGYWRRIH